MSEIENLKERVSRLEASVNLYIRQMYDEASGFGCRPEDALMKSRKIAEAVSKQLLRCRGEEQLPENITLNTLIAKLQEKDKGDKLQVPRQVITSLNNIRDRANQWCHENASEVPRNVLRSALADLSYLVEWFFYELLGEKRSWWKSASSTVLRHARSITVLGTAVVISITLLAAIFIIIVAVGTYRNFGPEKTEDGDGQNKDLAPADYMAMMAPKPAFIELDTDPSGAWCWIYPKSYKIVLDFKRRDASDEDVPAFGQTPFGKICRNLSMFALVGGGERGLEAFVFRPGYEPRVVSVTAVSGDVDFGRIKLALLDETKARVRTIKDLFAGSEQFAGTAARLRGSVTRMKSSSRNIPSFPDEETVESLPADPVFLSFSEPPFSDALALFLSQDAFRGLLQRFPQLGGEEVLTGEFLVYFPVAPFNSLRQTKKPIAELRQINGKPLAR
ncbi:MAG: hypothetical protein AB9869_08120 [Verrucomicrobiia bacterium]